jgi:hypothetical protein
MSVAGSLRAALGDMYGQSWRLLLFNAALSAAVLPFLVAALWAPLALVPAALVAGAFAAALMHCAVELTEEGEIGLRCFAAGLRLHWRRGLALGALAGLVFFAGGLALDAYGGGGAWVLAAVVLYVLVAFAAFQVALWPLAVAQRSSPLPEVLRAAAGVVLRYPFQSLALALALAVVNLVGVAAALLPFLTLTLAYSSLAAAHFTLPRNPLREASS